MVFTIDRRVEDAVNPNMNLRRGGPPKPEPQMINAPEQVKFDTDWHIPCERRVDGDRLTVMMPAREWLAGRTRAKGNLADVNPLVDHPHNLQPPALPRGLRRDHLHDRNREHALYDLANPGLPTYVRVTRRRGDTATELAMADIRQKHRFAEIARERQEAADATTLMQLRSASLREAMKRREQNNSYIALPPGQRPAFPPEPPADPRVAQIERKLQVMERATPTQKVQDQGSQDMLARIAATAAAHSATEAGVPAAAAPQMAFRSGWPVEVSFTGEHLKRRSQQPKPAWRLNMPKEPPVYRGVAKEVRV